MSDDDLGVYNAFLALPPSRIAQLILAWVDAASPAELDWGSRFLEELAALPTATSGPGQAPWCES